MTSEREVNAVMVIAFEFVLLLFLQCLLLLRFLIMLGVISQIKRQACCDMDLWDLCVLILCIGKANIALN